LSSLFETVSLPLPVVKFCGAPWVASWGLDAVGLRDQECRIGAPQKLERVVFFDMIGPVGRKPAMPAFALIR